MSEPFLVLDGVTKRFGETTALGGVSLDVGADELVVVLGPTGAGKTTLLRTVAGLETPEAGTVRMAGRDVTGLSPAERDVALVFQNFSLYPNWSVRRNLEFPLRAPGRGLDAKEISRRVEQAAEVLKITPLLARKSVHLSGGEMQRVAIGRAIVRRPSMFLMDEPLTNLDAKLREALRVELVVLQRELGVPMLFVTHDQTEALSMGRRIVVLSGGRILQSGEPEEVYRRPASPVVARQLGQPAINLLTVTRRDGQWHAADGTPVMPAGQTPIMPAQASGAGEQGEQNSGSENTGAAAAGGEGPSDGEETRTLGARPEDIAIDGGPAGATVRVVEHMGPANILLADWAGHEIHIIAPPDRPVAAGDIIHPRIDPARAVLW